MHKTPGVHSSPSYSTESWPAQSSCLPIKKEIFFRLYYQPTEIPPLKKRKIKALSANNYEVSFNNYLDFNLHLWHPEHIYSLSEVLAIVMGDSSDFQSIVDIVNNSETPELSGKFLSLLLINLRPYEEKLIKKSVDSTHQEVICFYILRHACEKRFGKECGKEIEDFNKSLLPNLISNLSISEKGQLVRYANLIDYPSQEAADYFRALIGPHLYKLVRPGTLMLKEWKSVKHILLQIGNQITLFTDPYLSILRKNFGENHILEQTRVSIHSSIQKICLELIARIESGVEVQLPKFAHSVGKKSSKDGLIPELFFTNDIREINSEEANMVGAFESTRIEETFHLPALMLTYENEWRKDQDLKNYFIPKQEGPPCTDFWLGWKKTIPTCRRNFNGSVKGSSIFGIVVEGNLVEEQKKRLEICSISLPHLKDIFVLSRDEALLFERSLKKFPLFLPLHLQEKAEANLNKKTKTEALNIPSKPLAFPHASEANLISVACRNSTQTLFLRKLEQAIQSRGKICMMCDDSGLIYSQNDRLKFPNKTHQQAVFQLNMLMLFTIANPEMTQKAIIQGIICSPLMAQSLVMSKKQLELEQKRSDLIQSVFSVFPGLKCPLPPGRRNIWPHQNLHANEVVGFNPLLSFNFIKIQTLLARESIELFYSYNSSRFEPQVFFKFLALQILSKAVVLGESQNQVLQTTFSVDNQKSCDVIIDHNTFDSMDEEYGFNIRLCPNEPLLTHFLIQDTGVELIRSAILKTEDQHPKKVELALCFLSEVAKGIEKRYFFKSVNPQRKLPRTLNNSPLLAILNMLDADFQADILDIHDYEGLIMRNSKRNSL